MSWHLEKSINLLKSQLLLLGAEVEKQLQQAVQSFVTRNTEIARKVIDYDRKIDDMEVDFEEECLKCLALHQPVAIDLRFIVSVLKINNDLERIGDLAANIAKRTLDLETVEGCPEGALIEIMAERSKKMLTLSLDSLVKGEEGLARTVLAMDDEVDELNRQVYTSVIKKMESHKSTNSEMMAYLSVSRSLERIADLATNISEDVLYLIKGQIVRHQSRNSS